MQKRTRFAASDEFEMRSYHGTRQMARVRLEFGRRRDGGYIILRNQS